MSYERANEYKSEFLANMSHELRTPLNSTLILAKLLADNKARQPGGEQQVKFAQTITSAGNDLLSLINDVLDLSTYRGRKGRSDTSRAIGDFAAIVDSLVKRPFRQVSRAKGHMVLLDRVGTRRTPTRHRHGQPSVSARS